jgi:hypothetical protein
MATGSRLKGTRHRIHTRGMLDTPYAIYLYHTYSLYKRTLGRHIFIDNTIGMMNYITMNIINRPCRITAHDGRYWWATSDLGCLLRHADDWGYEHRGGNIDGCKCGEIRKAIMIRLVIIKIYTPADLEQCIQFASIFDIKLPLEYIYAEQCDPIPEALPASIVTKCKEYFYRIPFDGAQFIVRLQDMLPAHFPQFIGRN